jgi:hypothetical protein
LARIDLNGRDRLVTFGKRGRDDRSSERNDDRKRRDCFQALVNGDAQQAERLAFASAFFNFPIRWVHASAMPGPREANGNPPEARCFDSRCHCPA